MVKRAGRGAESRTGQQAAVGQGGAEDEGRAERGRGAGGDDEAKRQRDIAGGEGRLSDRSVGRVTPSRYRGCTAGGRRRGSIRPRVNPPASPPGCYPCRHTRLAGPALCSPLLLQNRRSSPHTLRVAQAPAPGSVPQAAPLPQQALCSPWRAERDNRAPLTRRPCKQRSNWALSGAPSGAGPPTAQKGAIWVESSGNDFTQRRRPRIGAARRWGRRAGSAV
jgi:hypothetical protein